MRERHAFMLLILFLGAALCFAACRTVPAGYDDAVAASAPPPIGPLVYVSELIDARPEEERNGAGAGFMNASSKDASFSDTVAGAITRSLVQELRATRLALKADTPADYELYGRIDHYRIMLVMGRTTVIPLVSNVTWLWENDRYCLALALHLDLAGQEGIIFTRDYDLSTDTNLWVGIFALASRARRWDEAAMYRYLHTALQRVLEAAAADLAAAVRVNELRRRAAQVAP